MGRGDGVAIQVLTLLMLWVAPLPLLAQAPKPPSLQAEGSPALAGQQGETHDEVLTNSDVVKMMKVKLGDGIIISKIKNSVCSFDTSVDALVKLKEAGVSDAVIQAMHDAQEAAKAAAQNEAPSEAAAPAAPAGPQAALHNGNPALMLPTESGRTFPVELVDRNGERALRVRVQHNTVSVCVGYLYISRNRIAYAPVETPDQTDAFDLQRSEIKKADTHEKWGHWWVGIWSNKRNYYFVLLSPGGMSLESRRQALVKSQPVYDFIGRSLSDFDSVLREAETLTASLPQRP